MSAKRINLGYPDMCMNRIDFYHKRQALEFKLQMYLLSIHNLHLIYVPVHFHCDYIKLKNRKGRNMMFQTKETGGGG